MKDFFRRARKARVQYTPLVSVRISHNTLRNNLAAFQRAFSDVKIAPVLKSNAYGHGLVEVARMFDHDELPFFCIDTYAEALVLRNEGITTPLLILGYSLPENIVHSRLRDVAFTIASIDALRAIAAERVPFECHLKIDTGMHRQGIALGDIENALSILSHNPHIHVAGILSHLADADGSDPAFTQGQIRAWNECVARIRAAIRTLRFVHCAQTAGSRYAHEIDANIIRLGIGLYGCDAATVAVEPALELVSLVSAIRDVREGEKIGYGATYIAPRDMRVATIPLGYAEGIDRRLSNKGSMLVSGMTCQIVGRVSMNMTTLDVTDVERVRVGDEVIAISRRRSDANSCEAIARLCDTIPFEILVHIPATLRRAIL